MCDRGALRGAHDSTLTCDERALKYAPSLRFTSNERYFPTLPFFSAFDGVNNDSSMTDNTVDFADPDEIAPFDGTRWVFSTLREWYARLSTDEKRSIAAGFYRARECTAERVNQILKSDGPRYYRLEQTTRDYLGSKARITAYEYFYYYVNDSGIQGHPEDIETFYVFVPDGAPFIILVGAAHSHGDANNVAIWEWHASEEMPEIQAFVELGGHAMAPDLPPHGELYRHGFDTNWHVGDAWGIRDVVAIGGEGSLKRYDAWKSEARDLMRSMQPVCPKTKQREREDYTYFLVSAETFFGKGGPYSVDTTQIDDAVARAQASLKSVLEDVPVPQASSSSIDQLDEAGLARMRLWTQDGTPQVGDPEEKIHKASKHIVVQHELYTASSPTVAFKPYLFGSFWPHPFARRGSGPDGEPLLCVGGEIGLLAMNRVRSWLNMPGMFRLGVSYEFRRERTGLDLGYFTSTARRFTEYVQIGTIFPEWRIAGGFIGRSNPGLLWSRACFIELRGGVAFWHEEDLRFSKPSFEFSVATPIGGARQ